MGEIRNKADEFDALISAEKLEKYTYTLSQSEKQEFNLEDGDFKLMRTVFGNNASITVYKGAKKGAASGNDISEEGLKKIIAEGIAAAESSPEDPCYDFAPDQGKDVFKQGALEPDMEKFIERTKEFTETVSKEYPLVKLMAVIASYDRWNWISRNTNGTEFEGFGGQYHFSVELSASDGENSTGLDYTGFSMKDLDTPFIDKGDMRMVLDHIQKSIKPESLTGKFEGTLVLTPSSTAGFISMTLGNYAGSSVVMDGTSLWLDKVGEKVASDKLTVSLKPSDERITLGECATQDGFRTEDVTIIDGGVLKMHMLDLYSANKTGRPIMKNTGFDLVVEPGDTSFEDMIASVEKGLLLGGFSGGQPGTNGEFSGVAKNSFLIENGKITKAVTETMINGNLGEAVKNVRSISKELVCDGSSVVPYMAVDGIIISGK